VLTRLALTAIHAAIVSIGTELTRGELVDTNAAWLSDELTALGLEVVLRLTVDDDGPRIVEALHLAAERARFVVVTGGLGPTTDDLTTLAAARALGVELIRDDASVAAIQRRFASIGRPMSPSNLKQADFPVGAAILGNPVGTAPGFAVDLKKARLFFTPGVPAEMKRMFTDHIAGEVQANVERTSHQVRLRSFGLPESVVGERLAGLEDEEPGLILGYRASFPEIEVKVLVRAATEAEAQTGAERIAGKVRERLGSVVYGEGEDSLAAFVGRTLRDRGMTLAIAESCTGGLVGQLVTAVPGSSDYLMLDAVTYSNASKIRILGVTEDDLRCYGAVSEEVACAMADGAQRLAESDLAVSITGIAGPGGATEQKPIGTVWMALAKKGQRATAQHLKLAGNRDRIRTLAAYHALRWVADAALGLRER
jgi:nicotinamide-nucleotide amidase